MPQLQSLDLFKPCRLLLLGLEQLELGDLQCILRPKAHAAAGRSELNRIRERLDTDLMKGDLDVEGCQLQRTGLSSYRAFPSHLGLAVERSVDELAANLQMQRVLFVEFHRMRRAAFGGIMISPILGIGGLDFGIRAVGADIDHDLAVLGTWHDCPIGLGRVERDSDAAISASAEDGESQGQIEIVRRIFQPPQNAAGLAVLKLL